MTSDSSNVINTVLDIARVFQGVLTALFLENPDKRHFVLAKHGDDEVRIELVRNENDQSTIQLLNLTPHDLTVNFAKTDPVQGMQSETIGVGSGSTLDITSELAEYQDSSSLSLVSFNPSAPIKLKRNPPTVINYSTKYFAVNSVILLTPGLSFSAKPDRVSVNNQTTVDFDMSLVFAFVPPKAEFTVSGLVPAGTNQDLLYPPGNTIDLLVENLSASGATSNSSDFEKYMQKVMKSMGRQCRPITNEDLVRLGRSVNKIEIQNPKKKEVNKKFVQKLNELEEMGFPDKNRNVAALVASKGDLIQAINTLLA